MSSNSTAKMLDIKVSPAKEVIIPEFASKVCTLSEQGKCDNATEDCCKPATLQEDTVTSTEDLCAKSAQLCLEDPNNCCKKTEVETEVLCTKASTEIEVVETIQVVCTKAIEETCDKDPQDCCKRDGSLPTDETEAKEKGTESSYQKSSNSLVPASVAWWKKRDSIVDFAANYGNKVVDMVNGVVLSEEGDALASTLIEAVDVSQAENTDGSGIHVTSSLSEEQSKLIHDAMINSVATTEDATEKVTEITGGSPVEVEKTKSAENGGCCGPCH